MKVTVEVVAALAVLAQFSSPSQCATTSIREIYFDKAYWQSTRWDAVESSRLWLLPNWTPHSGEQSPNITYIKEREIDAPDMPLQSSFARFNGSTKFGYFVTLAASKISRIDCGQFLKEYTSRFGEPIVSDGTMAVYVTESVFTKLVFQEYQWDVGPTRIEGLCSGVVTDKTDPDHSFREFTWNAKYSYLADTKKLAPNFALRCSRRLEIQDRDSSDLPGMAMWIDTSHAEVKDADNAALSDANTFSANDSEIRFKQTRNKTTWEYTIDRVTGSLIVKPQGGPYPTARIHGNCEKSDRLDRKF
jgi:hypothetical protein